MKPEPSYPKHRAKLTLAACLAALFAVSLVPLQAQEVAADTQPANDADKDVVTLSPFEVTSDSDVGYQATSTLAGTRLQTKVRDIGASISIVNEEFLRDTNSNNIQDVLIFTPNTEVAGLGGNFTGQTSGNQIPEQQRDDAQGGYTRVRGLARADLTRNYWLTSTPFDSFNTESVTVQRGANSALFGLGSPGGVINNTTIKADFLGNRGQFKAATDTYGTQRFSMRYNQMIGSNVAIRVAGLSERKNYEQKQAFTNDDRAFVAVTVKLPFNLTARGSYEQAKRHEARPDFIPPNDGISPWFNLRDKLTYNTPAEAGAFYRGTGDIMPGIANSKFVTLSASGASSGFVNYYQDPSNPNATFNGTPFIRANRGIFNAGGTGEWMQLVVRTENDIIRGTGFRSDGSAVPTGSAPFFFGSSVDKQITDRSIYDYRENNFTGGSAQEDSKWKIYNASLDGTWLDNRLGLEVSYNKEEMVSTGNNALQGLINRAITIDTNKYMLATTDGTDTGPLVTNPNYGRPVMGGLSGGNFLPTDREGKRATGFVELRANDFLDDGWASKLLGKLRITGLVSQNNINSAERYGRDQVDQRIVSKALSGGIVGSAPTGISYATSRLGQQFALPVGSNTNFFNANSLSDLAGAGIEGVSYGPQRDRPVSYATYTGWDSVSGKFVTFDSPSYTLADNGGFPSAFYAGKSASELKSEVFIAQHYLWDDAIVLTGTWRKDSQSSAGVGVGSTSAYPQSENLFDPKYVAGPQRPYGVDADGAESTSWSIMIHTPDFVKRYLPQGWELSVYKSKASNFQPTSGSVNIFNQSIDPVSGTTVEEGFIVEGFDGKLSARVNFYTTQVQNNRFDAGGVSSTAGILQGLVEQLNNPANAGYSAADVQAVMPGPGPIGVSGFVPNYANATATTNRNSADNGTQDFSATGMEIEIAYNPTPHWTLLFTGGKQETVKSNTYPALNKYVKDFVLPQWVNSSFAKNYVVNVSGQTLAESAQLNIVDPVARAALQDGQPASEQAKWRYAFNTSYNFGRSSSMIPNWLGDLTVGGGYRWQDKTGIGFAVAKNAFGDYALDTNQTFYAPSQSYVDVFLRSRFALPHNRALSVQLNVKDLTNHDGLIPYLANPDGSKIYRIMEGRLITLSATLEF